MDASRNDRLKSIGRARTVLTLVPVVVGLVLAMSSSAGASSREGIAATTTSGSGGVLLALGGAVLVLGIVGFVVFTYTRRKRKPSQCAAQRDALELAEKSVKYWEAARAHLEAAQRERPVVDRGAGEESKHASLVAKAANGLKAAMIQRDECQMELIRCMASGVPAVPVIPSTQAPAQPFFTPGTQGPSSEPNPR